VKDRTKRNLTLSLPEGLIRSAKVLAAKRGTSVNALVRESLEGMVRSEDTVQDALERILSFSAEGLYRTTRKVSREELHER
jgi:plasmid stability protein